MDVLEAIRKRKSIRGFKPVPVPREILEEILEIASHAPSAMNTQPWEFIVLAGQVLDNIRQGNVEKLSSGEELSLDVPRKPYEGEYRRRQVELAIQLFEAMGIAREDRLKRAEWRERGSRFFDAPAALIMYVDRSVGEARSQLDIGTIVQTIESAAHESPGRRAPRRTTGHLWCSLANAASLGRSARFGSTSVAPRRRREQKAT